MNYMELGQRVVVLLHYETLHPHLSKLAKGVLAFNPPTARFPTHSHNTTPRFSTREAKTPKQQPAQHHNNPSFNPHPHVKHLQSCQAQSSDILGTSLVELLLRKHLIWSGIEGFVMVGDHGQGPVEGRVRAAVADGAKWEDRPSKLGQIPPTSNPPRFHSTKHPLMRV